MAPSGTRAAPTLSREGIVTGNTYDKYSTPNPFARALMRISRDIPVPRDASDEECLGELQSALDRVRTYSEQNIQKAGTRQFPYGRSNRDEH